MSQALCHGGRSSDLTLAGTGSLDGAYQVTAGGDGFKSGNAGVTRVFLGRHQGR
jgi:hypothetical protein